MLGWRAAHTRQKCPLYTLLAYVWVWRLGLAAALLTSNVMLQCRIPVVSVQHAVDGARGAIHGALGWGCRKLLCGPRLGLRLGLALRHGRLSREARPVGRRSVEERARSWTLRRRGRHLEGHGELQRQTTSSGRSGWGRPSVSFR